MVTLTSLAVSTASGLKAAATWLNAGVEHVYHILGIVGWRRCKHS